MISVGVDVSKGKSMVCFLKPYGEAVLSPVEFLHTEEGVQSLIRKILSYDEEIRVVMEATGAYHLPILMSLKAEGIFASVINPLVMKKYSSKGIRKGKTDKLDSVRIANYGLDNWFHLEDFKPIQETYEELKLLGRQYSFYIRLRVESKLALTNLLDRTMPGVKNIIKSQRADDPTKDKLADFVECYWHYDNITQMDEAAFALNYYTWAKENGYHANPAKAKVIYDLAKDGIPVLSSKIASTKMLVLESVRILKEVNQTIFSILSQMRLIAISLPEYPVVRAMNAVGDTLAPRLIAEIGDIRRFHSASALIAYAGIDSPPFESGSFVGTKRRISKRGSSLLRKTGYEVMSLLKIVKPTTDNAVYLYILKKESEGKAKKVAKIAALNKFLRIYYARVKEVYQD